MSGIKSVSDSDYSLNQQEQKQNKGLNRGFHSRKSRSNSASSLKNNSRVFIFAGPGGRAFGKKQVKDLAESISEKGIPVTIIGDGEETVSLSDLKESISREEKETDTKTVIAMVHGDTINGKHNINLDGECNESSEEFLKTVSDSADGKRIDVFLTACYGGDALKHSDILPPNSRVVALSPGNDKEPVKGSDVERIATSIRDTDKENFDISATGILETYLLGSLKHRIAPNYKISGQNTDELKYLLSNRIGKGFTDLEMYKIKEKLIGKISDSEIDRITSKISKSRDGDDIWATEYGPAIAICMAAS